MKKLVFVAVVLVAIIGISSTTQAFWGFFKKVEVKNEQAENNMAAGIYVAFGGESEIPYLDITKNKIDGFNYQAIAGGIKVKTVADSNGTLTGSITFQESGPIFDLTIKTTANTKGYGRYQVNQGLKSSRISNIAVGDIISVRGLLDLADITSFTVIAESIKDYSIQKTNRTFFGNSYNTNYSGLIKTIDVSSKTFVLSLGEGGEMTVLVSDSSGSTIPTTITIDGANKTFNDLAIGQFITSAKGYANTNTMKLDAREIKISTKTLLEQMVYQEGGIIVSVSTTTNTMIVNVAGMKYNIFMGAKMSGADFKNEKNNTTMTRGYFVWKLVNSVWSLVPVNNLVELGALPKDKVMVSGEMKKTGNTNNVDAYRVEKSHI